MLRSQMNRVKGVWVPPFLIAREYFFALISITRLLVTFNYSARARWILSIRLLTDVVNQRFVANHVFAGQLQTHTHSKSRCRPLTTLPGDLRAVREQCR